MVTRRADAWQTAPWRQALAESFTQIDPLLESLGLDRTDIPALDPNPRAFRCLVPRGFAALMRPGDPRDPLLRQVLPLRVEHARVPGYRMDPLDENSVDHGQGLLLKYPARALLIATGACAIHCRYCFRRHFDYARLGTIEARHRFAIARVARDPSIAEIILSGGDPLMLDDDQLGALIERLGAIAHLRRLRVHTRLPVVLPSRITESLCEHLVGSDLAPILVVHVNHPGELGVEAEQALRRLRRAGITLLNQSVLLRGVNDDDRTLQRLSERLFECGTLPYYLHQLDPVQGAAHFQVGDSCATRLLEGLRARLPGYLVPRLVREVPGAGSKRPLGGMDARSETPIDECPSAFFFP